MKKATFFYMSLMCIWLASFTAYAQYSGEEFLPERFLPETTLAVCVVPNLETMQEKFTQTSAYNTLLLETSPDVSRLFSAVERQFQQHFGIPLSGFTAFFQKSLAFALIDMFPSENSNDDWPGTEIVVIAEVNGSTESLKFFLETSFVKAIQSQEPTVEFGVQSFQGINSYILSNRQFQLSYAFVGPAFVLSQTPETIEKIIALKSSPWRNQQEPDSLTLFDTSSYRRTRDMAQQHDHEIRFYADIKSIWHKLLPFIRQKCLSVLSSDKQLVFELLDRYDVQAISWMFSLQQRGGYEQLFWEISPQNILEKKDVGLLSQLSKTGNGVLTSAQVIPSNSLYYRASRIDFVRTWEYLETMVEALLLPQQKEQFYSWKSGIEKIFRIDLNNDLLPAFGEELALACFDQGRQNRFSRSSLPTLEDFPCSLLIQIKEKDIIEQALRPLNKSISQPNNRQAPLQVIEIPGMIMPITIYTTFVQDFFVLSLSQSLIQEIMKVAHQRNSLASGTDFRELSSYFPAQAYAKGYINLGRILRRLQTMMNLSGKNQAEFPFFTVQPTGMMWVTTVVNGGFLTESRSPIGGRVTGTVTLGVGISWLEHILTQ